MLVDNEQMYRTYRGHNPAFVQQVWAKRREQQRLEAAEQAPIERARRKERAVAALPSDRSQQLEGIIARAPRSAKEVAATYAAERGYLWSEIIASSRNYELMAVRHGAIYAVREQFPAMSLPQIGRVFQRDHTTILSSIRKTERLMRESDLGIPRSVRQQPSEGNGG